MGFLRVILILQIKYTVMKRSKARTPDKVARPMTALKRVSSEKKSWKVVFPVTVVGPINCCIIHPE